MDTVADLIRALQAMPQDAVPYMATDDEGNSFSQVYSVQKAETLGERDEYQPIHPDDLANGEYGDNPETTTAVYIWP